MFLTKELGSILEVILFRYARLMNYKMLQDSMLYVISMEGSLVFNISRISFMCITDILENVLCNYYVKDNVNGCS